MEQLATIEPIPYFDPTEQLRLKKPEAKDFAVFECNLARRVSVGSGVAVRVSLDYLALRAVAGCTRRSPRGTGLEKAAVC